VVTAVALSAAAAAQPVPWAMGADILFRLKLGEFFKFGAGCLVALGAVFSAGSYWNVLHPISSTVTTDGNGTSDGSPAQVYFGYYGDLQADATTKISEERLELRFLSNSSQVQATSSGEVTLGEKKIQRTWHFSGFANGRSLVLSFETLRSKVDPDPSGAGVYILEKSNAGYTGTALYVDCALRSVVQCPYALAVDNLDTQAVRRKWPKLFERTCTPIELVPDQPAMASLHTSCPAKQN
jgi:hypothetical protein